MASLFLLMLVLSVSAVTSETCTKVATFNTALTRSVSKYETRKDDILKALLGLDADVVCLQEIWKEDDLLFILSQASKDFPYHFSALHSDVSQLRYSQDREGKSPAYYRGAACSDEDIKYFSKYILPCAGAYGCLAHLETSNGMEAVACMARNCTSLVKNETFNPDCLSCITVTSPLHTVSTSDCLRDQERSNRLNGAGLLLMSRKPIEKAVYHKFFEGRNMTCPRGYLSAEHPDLRKIYCSHMSSSSYPYWEYDLEYNNFREQFKDEVRQLMNKINEKELVLMGTLNTGPQIRSNDLEKNLIPDEFETYNSWVSSGYSSPYLAQDGRCTRCKSNPLADGKTNAVIDHILLKGERVSGSSMKRIFDQPPMSDHYGVQGKVCQA